MEELFMDVAKRRVSIIIYIINKNKIFTILIFFQLIYKVLFFIRRILLMNNFKDQNKYKK